jgi:hypothetical protein
MSSDQILSAADSASCPPTSEDSGEIFLASEEGWKEEANSVIRDVEKFVQFIAIADKIKVQLKPKIGKEGESVCCDHFGIGNVIKH